MNHQSPLYIRKEIIGDCILYLGDSFELISPLISEINSIVTDPPYGMPFRSNYRVTKHSFIANDTDSFALDRLCQLPVPHSKYVFCRWDNLFGSIPKPKSLITWVKNNWSMGDLNHEHARQSEVILFYAGPQHNFPAGRPTDVVHAARTGNSLHPTEKPISLMEKIVSWTSGVVFDPFMGSGTTGVACAKLGRKFIGVELDEGYFEIVKEFSASVIAATFNKHFKSFGTILAQNVLRDLGKEKGKSGAVNSDASQDPMQWYLLEAGKKLIPALIEEAKQPAQ